jgi:hypothetical protein
MSFETEPVRILTKEEIWAADDIVERDVVVPQWGAGAGVRIRTFSKKQADEMRKRATTRDRFGKEVVDSEMLEALLFIEGVVAPHFEVSDYERMQQKSAVAVSIVLKAIMDASGLSEFAVAEADKSNGARSNPGIRVLPSVGIEDDARGTPAEDVGQ